MKLTLVAQNFLISVLRVSILFAAFLSVIGGRWSLLFTSLLIFFLTFLPLLFQKRYRVKLPIEFELFVILFIYASLFLGEIHAYYTLYWWWDIILHAGAGIALGFIGFLIMHILYSQGVINAKPALIALFSFCFGLAIGAVWEIFEFAMDQLFAYNMQKSGLRDTMWDLIVDATGALLVSIAGYFYLKGNKTPLFTKLLENFKEENPHIIQTKKERT